jgi:hypothetical protein
MRKTEATASKGGMKLLRETAVEAEIPLGRTGTVEIQRAWGAAPGS